MDYDKLIEQLHIAGTGNSGNIFDVAALAIETLRADLARVTAERDAALVDLRKWKVCATCKQYNPHGQKSNCKVKKAYLPGGNWTGCSKWEWKGIKED